MKIRFKTWYWGKFVLSGTNLDGSIVTTETEGFEPYIEERHGWHHSGEAMKEKTDSQAKETDNG